MWNWKSSGGWDPVFDYNEAEASKWINQGQWHTKPFVR